MFPQPSQPLLPVDMHSPRLWAVLATLLAAVFALTVAFVSLIDALGGGAFITAIDEFHGRSDALLTSPWLLFVMLGMGLPPPAGWRGVPARSANEILSATRFFLFFAWFGLSPVLFFLLFVEDGSGFSLGLLPRPAFGLASILIFLLSANAFTFICLGDARIGLWTWLSGKAAPNPYIFWSD